MARIRVTNQHIAGSGLKSVKDVVNWMGAMQAQDFIMCKWALGIRLPGSTDALVEEAINRGDVLRTHLMRPTWHLVSSDDIRWLLDLTAPHIKRVLTTRHRNLELTDKIIQKSNALLLKSLSGNNHLTREEIIALYIKEGISVSDNRASHLLLNAEIEGLVCSGIIKKKNPTYALLSERVPATKVVAREEALGRLASKYFSSHGPATVQDFAWWSGLPVTDARKATNIAGKAISAVKTGTETYWQSYTRSEISNNLHDVHLIPAYDEFLISYKDRKASMSEEHFTKAVSRNGIFYPVIVVDGVVAGLWRRTTKNGIIRLETQFFRRPGKPVADLTRTAAGRYGTFLEKEIVIV